MGAEILVFIVSNPWRTACLAVALICLGLTTALRFQSLRLDNAMMQRKAIEAQITVMEAVGAANEAKIQTAAAELDVLKVKQQQATDDMNRLLENWPVNCDEAGKSALDILQGRVGK